jgi:hypothetical protein
MEVLSEILPEGLTVEGYARTVDVPMSKWLPLYVPLSWYQGGNI